MNRESAVDFGGAMDDLVPANATAPVFHMSDDVDDVVELCGTVAPVAPTSVPTNVITSGRRCCGCGNRCGGGPRTAPS